MMNIIKAARIAAGLTQKQLGIACGYKDTIADVAIRKIELGERKLPRDKIRIMAEVLKIPIETLVP